MTKEQIIKKLQARLSTSIPYTLDEDTISAINNYPNQFELVEPILNLISANPQVNFGMPGDLVHFVEHFYHHGYESLLIKSVEKGPTPHNIWMLHRCFNSVSDPLHDEYKKVADTLLASSDISLEIKNAIKEFDW